MSEAGASVFVVGFPGAVAREVARAVVGDGRRVSLLCPADARHEGRALAISLGDRLELIEGSVERIDFGLPGRGYLELAGAVDTIMSLTTPEAPGTGDPTAACTIAREVIELGLAAPHLKHVLTLSHLDVAGNHTGSFAERDLEIGQRFKGHDAEDRFKAERIYRRFMKDLPITVARCGWIVGRADDQLCPLVELLLAESDEALREGGRRLPLTELTSLVNAVAGLRAHAPPVGGRFLHLVGTTPTPALELAERVRDVAAQMVPGGLDLHAGARRSLVRGGGRWSRRRFFKRQPRATRYESAYSTGFLERHGLPLPELRAQELELLVEHAVEEITGFR